MPDLPLAGVRVLVTRPRQRAAELEREIEALGGSVIGFPTIDTVPRARADIAADAALLAAPDIAIFISANAVLYGLDWAASARLAAIGPSTAREIEARGRAVDICSPEGYTSEQLLAVAELQRVEGRVIRIIRGNGGRELLADTLRSRGAVVDYLGVYRRQIPAYTEADIATMRDRLTSGAIGVITVMSVETLDNLLRLLPVECHPVLARTPLVTPASRVINEVTNRFPGIPATLAKGPQARDMVAAIIACTKPGYPDEK